MSKVFDLPTPENPIAIIRGDCMRVMPRIPDESISHCFSDPPYGMSFQSRQRVASDQFEGIANDDQPYVWWLRDAARVLMPGGCLLCFCRWDSAEAFRLAIGWAGLSVKTQIIWDKVRHGMGDLEGQPAPQHETLWFATKGKYKLPGLRPSNIYQIKRSEPSNIIHSNQKPLELMRRLVRDFTRPGELILEPFGGSGTTALACLYEGRRCISIELEEEHCQLAQSRLDKLTDSGKLVPHRKTQDAKPEPLV